MQCKEDMKKIRLKMVSENFLEKLRGKKVHVEFVNDKNMIDWIEGILEYEFNENIDEIFIEITSDTDLNRLSEKQVKKIYLKE